MFTYLIRPLILYGRHLAAFACAALAVSCTAPESEICSSGIVCPIGKTCSKDGEACIDDDCGDGELQPLEKCDDGNVEDGDGCSANCKSLEICGDGYPNFATGEVCDDGNTEDGDECSSDCMSELVCGNEIEDPGEVCDDGNTRNGDGCSSNCQSDETCGNGIVDLLTEKCDYALTRDECNDDCTSNLSCGNGIIDPDEDCDDGDNGDNTDDCITVEGSACRAAYCGDGITRSNPADPEDLEECDDGQETTECNKDCTEVRVVVPGSPAGCGDGVINQELGEICDEGAKLNGTFGHCSAQCSMEALECGDGILTVPEVCDTALPTGRVDSAGNPLVCRPDCNGYEDYCGDGRKADGEACDHGRANHDTRYGGCTTQCEFGRRCGDANTDPEEQCDHGDTDGTDGNQSTPEWNGTLADAQCSTACTWGPYCGDGDLQNPQEACELSQTFSVQATLEGSGTTPYVREAECHDDCSGYCGDAKQQSSFEGCDEGPLTYHASGEDPTGNGADGEGRAIGGDPDSNSCRSDCTRCGDGITQGDGLNGEPIHREECDEGADNFDPSLPQSGCNWNCQLNIFCGDGETNGSEQCDAGDSDHGNGNQDRTYSEDPTCNTSCQFNPYCGDAKKNGPEDCDKGPCGDGETDCNQESPAYSVTPTACTIDCTWGPHCGDGTENGGEACDDGDANANGYHLAKTCSTTCTVNPHCGDDTATNGEVCDDGDANVDGYHLARTCSTTCTVNPYCGDDTATSGEVCDDGDKNVAVGYSDDGEAHCNTECKVNSYCGDDFCDGANEDDSNCHADCHCGNGVCEPDVGEENHSWGAEANRCGDCWCGDHVCAGGEADPPEGFACNDCDPP